MKISLERDVLLAQLQTVSRVASTRSAIQALSGVQLAAKQDGCELRATDMDVGLRVPLEAEVTREGTVVLPARLHARRRPRRCPPRLSRSSCAPPSRTWRWSSGNAHVPHPHAARRGLPAFPEPDAETAVERPGRARSSSTAPKVAGSASRDETRPVLTGILVSASERELRMVATDSYRLSVKETTLETPLSSGFEVNVPARALQELARLVAATARTSR